LFWTGVEWLFLLTLIALQYAPKLTIKVTSNGETKEEEGRLFSEATFIS
jgi:hypothetical protein